jgi:hypothetical protein
MSSRPILPSSATTRIALRFVADLQSGRRPSIEMALDQAPRDEWGGLLQSLLIAETNYRRSRGEIPVARDYLPRFPAHIDVVREVVPDLPASPIVVPTVPLAEEVVPQPPAVPVRLARYPEVPVLLVAPMPAVAARPAAPMAVALPDSFADLEPEVEFTPPLPRRRRRRARWLIGAVLLLLIAGTVFGISYLPRKPRGVEPPPSPSTGPAAAPKGAGYNPLATPNNATTDPERELAEWVLKKLDGRGILLPEGSSRRPFTAEAPLPKNKFQVTAITVPPEAAAKWTPEDLERLRGRSMLNSIQLHAATPITEAMLAPLLGLPLRTLELIGAPVRVPAQFFANFADLETLTLTSTPDWTDGDFVPLAKLGKLASLTMSSAKITPNGFKELKSPTIKSLTFGESLVLTPDHVRVLARLPLEEIESGAGMTDDAFLEFAVFPELKRIRMRKTKLTDAGLKALVGLGKLEEFRVDGSLITGAGIKELAERASLKIVDLSNAKLTNASVEMLLGLPPLKELRLAGNPINDQSANLLAQLEGAELLDLSATDISDVTLNAIKKIPTLKTLIVTNTKVTKNGARDFESSVPGCKVVVGRAK